MNFRKVFFFLAMGMVSLKATSMPSIAENKPPLPYSVEATWRSIGGSIALSNDGRWLAYTIQIGPPGGDGILVVRNIATGREYREPGGSIGGAANFTANSQYLLFLVPSKSSLGILDLSTGSITSYDGVTSFKLAEKRGEVAAFLAQPPSKSTGAPELIIRNLTSGEDQTIAGVTDYGFTSDGAWVAYIRKTAPPDLSPADGVYVRQIGSEKSTAVLSGAAHYGNLLLSKDHPEFAFTTDLGTSSKQPELSLYYWDARQSAYATQLVGPFTRGLLAGYEVQRPLEFSKDGERLFLSTAPIPAPKPSANAQQLKMDIWWTKEPVTPAMQHALTFKHSTNSPAVVWLPQRRFVQLGTTTTTEFYNNDNPRFGLLIVTAPYDMEYSWSYGTCDTYQYCDVYLVDLTNGQHRKIDTKSRFSPWLSPDGKYVANFNEFTHTWYLIRTSDLHRIALSVPGVHFEREDWGRPSNPAPYSVRPTWSSDGKYVFVNDCYDIWAFATATGLAHNVTAGYGRRNNTQFLDLFQDQLNPGPIDLTKPAFLQGEDLRTRAQGLYRVNFHAPGQSPKQLIKQNVFFANLVKARDADVVALTRERFDMVPDIYVTTTQFRTLRRITDVEPRQRQYAWGQSELIDYRNADGVKLQAILTKPGNFDPHKKYPMVVNIYEKLTPYVNRFQAPTPTDAADPNVSWYASHGYVVLQPDIVFKPGHPGWSSVHCVVPAVQRAISMGFVDPKRIGLTGHSWGGFQADFILTHTHIFAAVVSGAGASDAISFYGTLRPGAGDFGASFQEHYQSRIGGTLWEKLNLYVENSPVLSVPKVTAPVLLLADDGDGNIPWSQSLELFFALRRLGKQAWLINYNGDDHTLDNPDNQQDWTIRMDEFFDHYLKGAPAPDWMLHPI